MFYRTQTFRLIAATLAVLMTCEILAPTVAFALTSGPSQPEFVGGGGGGMVNPFTGDFSYSIPVLSAYPKTI